MGTRTRYPDNSEPAEIAERCEIPTDYMQTLMTEAENAHNDNGWIPVPVFFTNVQGDGYTIAYTGSGWELDWED